MADILGVHYENSISLSAYPAFLSVGNFRVSKNIDKLDKYSKNQKKFLDKKGVFLEHFKTPEKILEETKLESFKNWLTSDFISNTQEKIKSANRNKIKILLVETKSEVSQAITSYTDLKNKLDKNGKNVVDQLEAVLGSTKNSYKKELNKALSYFKRSFRKAAYKKIDKEIDNKQFKRMFEEETTIHINRLSEKLKKEYEKIQKDTQKEIDEIISKYNKYKKEILSDFEKIAEINSGFSLELDIDNNLDITGTLLSLGVAIAGVVIVMLSNPAGWVVLALSVLNLVITVGKAIWEFVDHSYRTARQKQKANQQIDKIVESIKEDVTDKLTKVDDILEKNIDDIKKSVKKDTKQIDNLIHTFKEVEYNFGKLISDFR
ncbi:MAG: hypothetical protein CSA15_09190 [Candidatus Delongbacteria bacterium]|nr:MAG: hypothetical protein CSA15_09190 [Candidatus Delongbacteria bacterium]